MENDSPPRAKRPKKRTPTRYHHGDLRRALMDQALLVVEKRGVDAVKMSDLAKALRVSSGAPFRHFENKEALLVALAEEGALRMVQALDEAVARTPGPLLAERARGVAYVRFAVTERAVFRLLARTEILAASPMLRAMSAAQEAAMEPVLGRGHQGHAARALAQRSAGLLAAQALTYGLARMITDGLLGPLTPDDAERLAFELTGVLGDGLRARDLAKSPATSSTR